MKVLKRQWTKISIWSKFSKIKDIKTFRLERGILRTEVRILLRCGWICILNPLFHWISLKMDVPCFGGWTLHGVSYLAKSIPSALSLQSLLIFRSQHVLGTSTKYLLKECFFGPVYWWFMKNICGNRFWVC